MLITTVPPPNMDTRTLCQVEVTPRTSEGIEPFTLANSPPGQVEVSSSRLINSLSGQVRVTPHKSEGIEPFTTVNSPPCQVRVTPHKSEGIEPFTTVNSLPCQVRVTLCNPEGIEPFSIVNSPPCQVGDMSSHLINTLLGSLRVTSSISS